MSVLKFFRGLDISGTSFKDDPFPSEVDRLLNVRWIKLNSCDLDMLPSAVNRLPKLEYVSIKNNELLSIGPSVTQLTSLRSFRAANNALEAEDISRELYKLEDLTTLDLSSNSIDCIPEGMTEATGLLVLDLSHNKLKDLSRVFLVKVTDIEFLDLSHNQNHHPPRPQLRRLANLRTLLLSGNPLANTAGALRAVSALEHLVRIVLRGTARRAATLPPELAECICLEEIDLAENEFAEFPEVLTLLPNLREVNLSDNQIVRIPGSIKDLQSLRILNVSRNALRDLKPVCGVTSLVRVYANGNNIVAIPDEVEALANLEVLRLARNRITDVPHALCTLQHLKDLCLDSNAITQLPVALHHLPALAAGGRFSARSNPGNPSLPPKRLLDIPGAAHGTRAHVRRHGTGTAAAASASASAHATDAPATAAADTRDGVQMATESRSTSATTRPCPPRSPSCYGVDMGRAAAAARRTSGSMAIKSSSHQRGHIHALEGPGLRDERGGDDSVTHAEARVPTRVKVDVSQRKQAENILRGLTDTDSTKYANETPELLDSFQDSAAAQSTTATDAGDEPQEVQEGQEGQAGKGDLKSSVGASPRKPKTWKKMIKNPKVDGKTLFGDDFDDFLGTKIWRIEDFAPALVNELDHGTFYEADCYIVLDAKENEVQDIVHTVYFWIGSKSSLDKQASAAINAVNLRAYLHVDDLCQREEQEDESREFLLLFGNKINYIEGGTESGFYTTEEVVRPTRMYHLKGKVSLTAYAVPTEKKQLRKGNVYVVDEDEMKTIWLWVGKGTGLVTQRKACLFCEKATKGTTMKVVVVQQGSETDEFLDIFGDDDTTKIDRVDADVEALQAMIPTIKLHEMHMGDGFLELPQVVPAGRAISRAMLASTGVYIIDHWADMYIWIGHRSSRLVRAAAARVALELQKVLPRPDFFLLSTVTEGTEPQVFKSKFEGWDDVLKIDHRAKDVIQVEANVLRRALKSTLPADQQRMLNVLPEQLTVSPLAKLLNTSQFNLFDATHVDVGDLFTPPPLPMPEEDARAFENNFWADLDNMEAFVLKGGHFKVLDKSRVGHFFSGECYIYLCSQWRPVPGSASDEKEGGDESSASGRSKQRSGSRGGSRSEDADGGGDGGDENDDDDDDEDDDEFEGEEELQCVAYFWQGRDVSKMAWLQFRFGGSLERIEALVQKKYRCQLRVQREFQHRESLDFMALFDRGMVIHEGTYDQALEDKTPRLFRVHEWKPTVFTKAVQERLNTGLICCRDCYLLQVPFEGADDRGILYVWHGDEASKTLLDAAQELGQHSIWGAQFSKQVIAQGHEPEHFFLSALGVSKLPETVRDGPRIDAARFWACTNRDGFFRVEERSDWFCQDDLMDEDAAIVDTHGTVYLWIGPFASDVLIKLATASVQEYVRQLPPQRNASVEDIQTLIKGGEPFEFTSIFHGWSHHLQGAKELSKPLDFLGHVKDDQYQRQFYDNGKQGTHQLIMVEEEDEEEA
ncbi:hypothetical protein PTSG_04098 [Salpingoeca rosetta]|uniref:Gelsolin-like domain-containing protein n=1 Tax=Salpingoeca rosetta (strain ATCC 50818 / BSB-021) TaxID=946362 RepID=F2U6K8_SALR5|nr:uncharacterized protein PTSG_04098 [Salpingoeca rosetta]EGD83490.1 hypothetical protein PTSG_04098 [Salpingoeca rosetta]|eukprot:XP_004994994.1 hypothetical protein PTSG_04098 [Salpingoeca rosetta]